MSKSRVKRSYDNFCGEESMMVTSPQCSPLRITSLGGANQLNSLDLPSTTNSNSAHQPIFGNPHHPQRLNFDECKEEQENTSMSEAPAASSGGFSSFNFQPTFSSFHSTSSPFATNQQQNMTQSQSSTQPTYFSPAPAAKRVRKNGAKDVSMIGIEEEDQENDGNIAPKTPNQHESPFTKLKRPPLDDLMFVPRAFKKQAIAAALSGPSSSAHATPICAPSTNPHLANLIPAPPSSNGAQLPNYHHQLFTYDQVASIVKNALEMREEQIRAEYNKTLQELLREQFENFSSFNRDYISRNMKARDQQEGGEDWENSYYS